MTLVRFHPLLVTSISRPPTNAELFMAYNLHFHTRRCELCQYSLTCSLFERIAKTINDRLTIGPDGYIYSITAQNKYQVRVEIPVWLSTRHHLEKKGTGSVSRDL